MGSDLAVWFVVGWAICGVIASLIWQHKGGKPASGFWLGALLGLIGIVYVTLATPQTSRWSADPLRNPARAAADALRAGG